VTFALFIHNYTEICHTVQELSRRYDLRDRVVPKTIPPEVNITIASDDITFIFSHLHDQIDLV
jgi:hypothetical protein